MRPATNLNSERLSCRKVFKGYIILILTMATKKIIEKLKKLNCEIENGDNKFNRFEDFKSIKNKINLIIEEINKRK